MAVNASDDYGVGRSLEGFTSGQHCQYGEALAEWRSCEQVDNGTPSTSPPYWDIEDDDDFGAKPPELYGRYTWKIEKFSQTSKRELKSEVFDVGSYKWYILIYPQGCDVCNHLSLFLCVANHEKLLPGWSHFAQFTIAVVNKDPKKSKYSDTLHRFWKKEHDWGWKKFMELSKVQEGFVVADTLEIKAQVQIIREKAHRPFRCLDRQYRRELVRVYLTNVEQICRRFVEERRGKLGKLIEDRVRWLSFCAFWVGVDHKTRDRMSREKTDVILRVVVKHFFVEKEVTSTLVMDSLNSGLKALEAQSRSKKGKANLLVNVETSAPIVRVEDDMFVLVDDVLSLLERAALEPSPPKDEKGLQNRTKDGNFGEDFNKDSIERDERRLTELGRKTVEIFVLAHIFSNKIEVAYQEAVALKRQEELIREEEAAELAEIEQKAKRRVAEKEKRSKKKLSKQKRGSRKGKDRGKDEKCDVAVQDKHQRDSPIDERIKENTSVKLAQSRPEMLNVLEVVSDVSDIEDDVGETTQLDAEDRDTGPVNWDIDTSEAHPSMEPCSRTNGLPVQNGHAEKSSSFMDVSSSDTGPVNWDIDTSEAPPSMEPCGRTNDLPVQNGHAEKSSSLMDDSSSTCSTDSVPSVAMNGPCKGNILPNYKSQKSPSRRKNQGSMETCEQISQPVENNSLLRDPVMNAGHLHNDASRSSNSTVPELKAVSSLKDRVQTLEQHLIEKKVVVLSLKKLNVKDQVDFDGPPKQTTVAEASSSPRSSTKTLQPKSVLNSNAVPVSVKEVFLTKVPQTDAMVPSIMQKPQNLVMSKPDVQKTIVSKPLHRPIDILVTDQVPVRSRSSNVAVPGSRSTAPTVSMVQTASSLPWSVCAAGRLDPDPSPATDSFVPQSFRNTITAKNLATNVIDLLPPSSLADNPLLAYSQPPALVLSPQSTMRTDQGLATSGFTFGSVTPEVLHNQPYWTDSSHDNAMGTALDSSFLSGSRDLDSYGPGSWGLETDFTDEFPAGTSAPQAHRFSLDGFPHLDIINSLLDEELGNGKTTNGNAVSQSPSNGFHPPLTRQFTFRNEMSSLTESTINGGRFDQPMAYYHNDDIQPLYGSFTSHMNGLTDASLQVDFPVYGNGQIDGGIQNQWPVGFGSNLCLPSDGYPFHMPEYSNLVCGADGYTILQHSNGH